MKENLEAVREFIKEHRSNEKHFAVLDSKLDELIGRENNATKEVLVELKQKHALAYKESREANSSDWPLFEQFVQEFEKIILQAIKNGSAN